MEHAALGTSGIRVSALSLGSWQTLELLDEKTGLDVISAAIEAGITFLDDARYDDRTGKAPLQTGYSEVVFGRLLHKGGWRRDRLLIANKLWFEFHPAQSIAAELDGSLSRLGLDYLDLLYCAPPGEALSLAELVPQMSDLVRMGKIRSWGVLNWPAKLIQEACSLAIESGAVPPVAAQLPYSLLRRTPVESDSMRELCARAQISIVASSCLAGGLLTGKYDAGTLPPDARLDSEGLAAWSARGVLTRVRALSEHARSLGVSPAQLALAFCLAHPQVCSVLFGARSVRQLHENLGCLELSRRLEPGWLERLSHVSPLQTEPGA